MPQGYIMAAHMLNDFNGTCALTLRAMIIIGFYLSHTCFCFLLHLLYISAYSLHLCPGGATSKITRWSVLLPCNSQNSQIKSPVWQPA